MKLYLDTCIISGIAKGDLNNNELLSIERILLLYKSGKIELVTSTVAKDEIDKIPEKHRTNHSNVYLLLSQVPALDYLVLDLDFGISILPVKQHPVYRNLNKLLKDQADAKHIFQAHRNGVDYFITVDERTILLKSKDIKALCGVTAMSPTGFNDFYNNQGDIA